MKLNDPFGRMERRHQIGYESMRDALKKADVDTVVKAQKVIDSSQKRLMKFVAIVSALIFSGGFFIPNGVPIALVTIVLLVVWGITSNVNGKRYVHRYIKEEL